MGINEQWEKVCLSVPRAQFNDGAFRAMVTSGRRKHYPGSRNRTRSGPKWQPSRRRRRFRSIRQVTAPSTCPAVGGMHIVSPRDSVLEHVGARARVSSVNQS